LVGPVKLRLIAPHFCLIVSCCCLCFLFFFFFSSRRRHTRLVSDWSSDVCSSDLSRISVDVRPRRAQATDSIDRASERRDGVLRRSEERRVGKEGRSRGAPCYLKKKRKKGEVERESRGEGEGEERGETWCAHSGRG